MIGLGLVASWVWIVGRPPGAEAKTEAKLAYLESGALLVGSAVFCLLLASIGAVILARAARTEYREALSNNLKGLVKTRNEE